MDIDRITGEEWRRISKEIEWKTRQLLAKPCFTWDDKDDLQQDLWVSVILAIPHFDPDRGTLGAFVGRVLYNSAARLIAKQMAGKRRRLRETISWELPFEDDIEEPEDLSGRIDQTAYLDWTGHGTYVDESTADLRSDVKHALHRLPDRLRELCKDLGSKTISDIARERGVCRSTIYVLVAEVRRCFEDAGLDEYLD
ncbi:MAG: sigma-70 family RNA polymerase sigma factor [Candidatus Eisenbacteria bacterium]